MKKAWPEKSTLFYYSICCSHLSRTEKMSSDIQFYENGMPNIRQMEEIMLKLSEFRHNHLPSVVKMLAKFIRRGIRVKSNLSNVVSKAWTTFKL